MSAPENKRAFYLIAGVNGAGKSSLGKARFEHTGINYLNPDLVQQEENCTPAASGRRVITLVRQTLQQAHQSLALETTLSGHTYLGQLSLARQNDYACHLIFVGLASVKQHIERVRARVQTGGHDIPEEDIRRRYVTTYQHLAEALPLFDTADFYDNSALGDPRQVGTYRNGQLEIDPLSPIWLQNLATQLQSA